MTQRTSPQPAKQAPFKAFNAFNLVGWTVGSKTSNTINVALQLEDARGQAIQQVAHVELYLSDNADGSTLTATATTSALAVGTNGVILDTPVSEKVVDCITNGSGQLDINVIQTSGGTNYYLVARMPDGSVAVSPEISF